MLDQKKIKVAFVVTNLKATGPINQTYYIIKYLDRDVFEPVVITMFPEGKTSKMDMYKGLGVEIHQLNLGKAKSLITGKNAVKSKLAEIGADIVQAVGIPPYRMTLSYDSAHLVTLRNYCYEDYPGKYGKLKGTVLAYLDISLIKRRMKKGDHFVTCSKSLSKMYKDRLNLDFDFIQNGVDVSMYQPKDGKNTASIRSRLGLPFDKLIFIYTGAIGDRKNQEEAIVGFLKSKASDKGVLVLVGDGDNLVALQKKYKRDNIIFTGKKSNVAEYLAAADIYITTSKSEGMPNGVLEAMSVGLPVLMSNIPQHTELLDANHKIGYSYRLGDVDDLSVKIDTIANADLLFMGSESMRTVNDGFTAEIMSSKYQNLYKVILSR